MLIIHGMKKKIIPLSAREKVRYFKKKVKKYLSFLRMLLTYAFFANGKRDELRRKSAGRPACNVLV